MSVSTSKVRRLSSSSYHINSSIRPTIRYSSYTSPPLPSIHLTPSSAPIYSFLRDHASSSLSKRTVNYMSLCHTTIIIIIIKTSSIHRTSVPLFITVQPGIRQSRIDASIHPPFIVSIIPSYRSLIQSSTIHRPNARSTLISPEGEEYLKSNVQGSTGGQSPWSIRPASFLLHSFLSFQNASHRHDIKDLLLLINIHFLPLLSPPPPLPTYQETHALQREKVRHD